MFSSFIRWIKTHDLLTFFVLTFLFTFGVWFMAITTGVGTLQDFALWGPALSAILITTVTRGKPGLLALFRRLLLWRVPARWYLVIFLGWPAISIQAALLHAQLTNQPVMIEWSRWSGFLTWLFSALVLGFWACEEIGWRGFALPRLLERWNALFSSIVLGIVWAGWHLPYYLRPEGIHPDFYPFVVFAVSLSILMTWVFNHTQGSILVATFLHFWVNVYDGLQADKLSLTDPGGQTLIESWLLAGVASLVVVLYGYRSLTRYRERPARGIFPQKDGVG
jgi:membrane protease YdiL (CAAX protease family)